MLEQSNYYPYGMKHSNYNDSKHDYDQGEGGIFAIIKPVIRSNYQYKYNGKEYQDELGLNLYDMDFRDYDPAIARWTGIDPVVHYSQSTYNAFDGNPVFWADPSGADATTYVRGSDGEWKQSSVQSDEEFKDDLRRFGLPDYLNHLSQGNVDGGTKSNPPTFQESISAFMTGLGISTSTKQLVLSLADEALIPKMLTKTLNFAGKLVGFYSVYEALDAYIENPTTANLVRLTVNC
ncbi:RHS repeat-associated core domain-containing protein [Flavobacterium sp.]|uniref:RHS repeat-associated core domain-containing protein n=1 Tax=Flavobacterium sp. TaxID=239 RepID=UPI0026035392|nr:RHS repeat-associated core domain-containing protein [Flavobacterium sp.]MDD3005365.1 hypothetical protein [Flavobacterium sp.]